MHSTSSPNKDDEMFLLKLVFRYHDPVNLIYLLSFLLFIAFVLIRLF